MKSVTEKIKNIFSLVITVVSVCIMIFTVVSSVVFNKNDRNIFGYKFFIVLSDSMSATDFSAGDVIVSKTVDPETLKEGDIITFQSENPSNYGEVVTHKIRRLTTDAEGNPGFITYGTTKDTDDETVATYSFILGKYKFHIPKLGIFFNFLKTVPGFFVCIFVPFMLLIIIQGAKSVALFRQYKKEQREILDNERREIAEEKAKNEEMMKQLLEMQAKLAQKDENGGSAEEKKE